MKLLNWARLTVLITGGTGSFGQAFTRHLLRLKKPPTIRIFSRDEYKQYQMQEEFDSSKLRFLLGDVRDKERLFRAMDGVDIVVHAAALKHIPAAEYNPFEPIKTNILGTQNVIEACLNTGVKKALLISSDKAAHPVNLYGATKLCAEKLFVQGNVYGGKKKTVFAVVRYGNVLGSRGSVVPLFKQQKANGLLTITHKDMTRFWITLQQACEFVARMVTLMQGGEIFVPKLPSVKVVDVARAISPRARLKITGVRPGEKLHETLITEEESSRTIAYKDYFVILPEFPFWRMRFRRPRSTKKTFSYSSGANTVWLDRVGLKRLLLS